MTMCVAGDCEPYSLTVLLPYIVYCVLRYILYSTNSECVKHVPLAVTVASERQVSQAPGGARAWPPASEYCTCPLGGAARRGAGYLPIWHSPAALLSPCDCMTSRVDTGNSYSVNGVWWAATWAAKSDLMLPFSTDLATGNTSSSLAP